MVDPLLSAKNTTASRMSHCARNKNSLPSMEGHGILQIYGDAEIWGITSNNTKEETFLLDTSQETTDKIIYLVQRMLAQTGGWVLLLVRRVWKSEY